MANNWGVDTKNQITELKTDIEHLLETSPPWIFLKVSQNLAPTIFSSKL
jgi:hypothetical protein